MNKRVIIIGCGECLLRQKNGRKIDSFDYVVRMSDSRVHGYESFTGVRTDMIRIVWKRHFYVDKDSGVIMFRNTELQNFTDILFTEIKDNDIFSESIHNLHNNKFNRWLVDNIYTGCVVADSRDIIFKKRKTRLLHDACLNFFTSYHSAVKNIYYYNSKLLYDFTKRFCNGKEWIIPSNGLLTINYIINTMPAYDVYITGFDGFASRYYWKDTETFFKSHSSVYEQMFLKKLMRSGEVKLLE